MATTSELIAEAIKMLSDGMYMSSYEQSIVDKLHEAKCLVDNINGPEDITIKFNIIRGDLRTVYTDGVFDLQRTTDGEEIPRLPLSS